MVEPAAVSGAGEQEYMQVAVDDREDEEQSQPMHAAEAEREHENEPEHPMTMMASEAEGEQLKAADTPTDAASALSALRPMNLIQLPR